jgi:hypothetical protein
MKGCKALLWISGTRKEGGSITFLDITEVIHGGSVCQRRDTIYIDRGKRDIHIPTGLYTHHT